ncbi:MAG: enoyl-CoA hydratase/isomerase family protein [Gemmatimonadaceae bacterium]|nr:enoyl-CoA hydratase/isomerase family protein [Gemmatimonadaceae bacterium]
MAFEHLLLESSDRIVTVTINRPDKLNALNADVLGELDTAFDAIAGDSGAGGVIVTGAGRSFVAGADIAEIASEPPASLEAFAKRGQALFRRIEQSRKPVVAAVNGFALGGGCELALACHVRFASTKAKFGLPEVKLGLIPGYGGTQRLPRLVGRGAALRLILSGEPIDGPEAYRIGLADAVAEPEALLPAARSFVASVLANGPVAVARALDAVDLALDLTLDEGLTAEARLFSSLGDTADMREGTRAFLEKRAAAFRGA